MNQKTFDITNDTTIEELFKAKEDKETVITYENKELDSFQKQVINHIYNNSEWHWDEEDRKTITLDDIYSRNEQFFAIDRDEDGDLTIAEQDGVWTHFEGAMNPEIWLEDWMTTYPEHGADVE
jgi:hypothetical protein